MKIPRSEKKPGVFERLWIFLWGFTPVRFRRMSLLSSLYASMAGCSEDEHNRLDQVNRYLCLTNDIHNMRFSVLVAPYLWRSVLPIQMIDQDRIETYVNRLVNNIPCWLRYNGDDQLKQDLSDLIWYCIMEKDIQDVNQTA